MGPASQTFIGNNVSMRTFYSKVVSIGRESFCNATPWVSACSVDLTQTCWVRSLLNYQREHGLSLQDPILLLVLCESTGINRSHGKISRFVWSHSLHFLTFSINSRRAFISTMLLKLLLSRSLLVSVLQNLKITSLNFLTQSLCSVYVADCFVFLNALSCLGFHDTEDSAFFFIITDSSFLVVCVGYFKTLSKCQSATQLGFGHMFFSICSFSELISFSPLV